MHVTCRRPATRGLSTRVPAPRDPLVAPRGLFTPRPAWPGWREARGEHTEPEGGGEGEATLRGVAHTRWAMPRGAGRLCCTLAAACPPTLGLRTLLAATAPGPASPFRTAAIGRAGTGVRLPAPGPGPFGGVGVRTGEPRAHEGTPVYARAPVRLSGRAGAPEVGARAVRLPEEGGLRG